MERFFKDVFLGELDALIEIYASIFAALKTKYPKVQVLVHGYDYPRPLAADSGNAGRLGRFLTEKKIIRDKDRRQQCMI